MLAGWRTLLLWPDGGKLELGCLSFPWRDRKHNRREAFRKEVKWLIFVLLGLFCLFVIALLYSSFFFVGAKVSHARRHLYLSQCPLPLPLALQFAEPLGEQDERQIHLSNISLSTSFRGLKFSGISWPVWFIAWKTRTQLGGAVCNRYEKEGRYFMLLLSAKIDL